MLAACCARRTPTLSDANASAAPLMTAQALTAIPTGPADARIAYGDDSSQFGELRIPGGSGPHLDQFWGKRHCGPVRHG